MQLINKDHIFFPLELAYYYAEGNINDGWLYINKDFDFTIYPNPSSGVYHLKSNNPEFKGVEVYSIQGVKVKEELELILDISNLPSGVYFVKEIGNNSLTQKIIKN
jgi:hypothetical protein